MFETQNGKDIYASPVRCGLLEGHEQWEWSSGMVPLKSKWTAHRLLGRTQEALAKPREHPFAAKVPLLLRPAWIAVVLLGATAYVVFGLFW